MSTPAPNPMRFRESCPDCGLVPRNCLEEQRWEARQFRSEGAFDCPRCGAHYSREDYLAHLHEKHMAQHHNHAEADLSGEEDL